MRRSRPILRVGLTGGIASGKTTVSAFLTELGAFVLDADSIAHQVMEPGASAFGPVVSRFGGEILDATGRIDRSSLGRIVFRDGSARAALNAIVHPLVMIEIDIRIERFIETGSAPVAVIDAALLVEGGVHEALHRLIVVRCSRDVQLQRLLARGGMTAGEALARIDSQAPLAEKLAVADYVVNTDTTMRETRLQTEKVYASLLAGFEGEFGKPGQEPLSP